MSKKSKKTKEKNLNVDLSPVLDPSETSETSAKVADSAGKDDSDYLGPTDHDLQAVEASRLLLVSESARQQDERRNTPAGEIKNPGQTNEYIEIIQHRHPAVEAAIRGAENADKQTGTQLAEGIDPAPGGADHRSGNSITGAVRPAAFAPWDKARQAEPVGTLPPAEADIGSKDEIGSEALPSPTVESELVKDELIDNLNLAGKANTDTGKLEEDVDPLNPAEDGASKASAVGDAKKSEIAPTATPDTTDTNTESES